MHPQGLTYHVQKLNSDSQCCNAAHIRCWSECRPDSAYFAAYANVNLPGCGKGARRASSQRPPVVGHALQYGHRGMRLRQLWSVSAGMPSNAGPDSPNSLSHNWCSNAEEQAINPLCSPGNKSAFDYLVERIDDRKITQDRARGLYIQVALCMLGIAIFARNFHVSVQLTYERPRALASWCCLVQTTAGCVWAYDCNRWIRRFGFFILIIPPSVVYMAFNEPATFQPNIGCVGNVPKYYSWLRFGMEALLNVIFSAAFLNVVYR
ncbi:hypothetical protein THASP1DRAFT_26993, partial [Thamnocephalis sphaerospora]